MPEDYRNLGQKRISPVFNRVMRVDLHRDEPIASPAVLDQVARDLL
jgi:hypothetical protein